MTTEQHLKQNVLKEFTAQFGTKPTHLVRAPGRVNLIGEHTDYNDGFVLPMAIDRAIYIALRPRTDDTVQVMSLDMGETAVFHMHTLTFEKDHWSEYVKGVTAVLQEEGYTLNGWDGAMQGNVPKGSGLSSSAALELAITRALTANQPDQWQASQMALLSQKAENEWVGVNCGIMDQMISASGQAGKALLIDCRTLESELVPLPPQTRVIIMDTATRRGLVDSAYNERRQQCEEAATFFNVDKLRDVSLTQFEAKAEGLPPLTRQRAQHVITENARTQQAALAMKNGDATQLGQLMNQSHLSLRDDFEVSSDALNQMVEIAQAQTGCYGARMTGAGFGGCAVALVDEMYAETFTQQVSEQYEQATNLKPALYVCQPTDGAMIWQI